MITRYAAADDVLCNDTLEDSEADDNHEDFYEDEEEECIQTRLVHSQETSSTIRINKVSITESPILAASHFKVTVYLVLNIGASSR